MTDFLRSGGAVRAMAAMPSLCKLDPIEKHLLEERSLNTVLLTRILLRWQVLGIEKTATQVTKSATN